ncbi:3122_t:CDS:2 [Cetraspora pellucida]|uniref:3122_t:CDS:1 n=1 Tax=Cetraspora pellucida TaxID=1433469 RepID=A0ACA9KQQ1_9GLOM|nr:3122_t:CDS:2 [Cetraspora pellucida]
MTKNQVKTLYSSGRKVNPVWNYFTKREKYNNTHHNANCDYCKEDCVGEPRRMATHLAYQCKPAKTSNEYDDFINIATKYNLKESEKTRNTIRNKINEKRYTKKHKLFFDPSLTRPLLPNLPTISKIMFSDTINENYLPPLQTVTWNSKINGNTFNISNIDGDTDKIPNNNKTIEIYSDDEDCVMEINNTNIIKTDHIINPNTDIRSEIDNNFINKIKNKIINKKLSKALLSSNIPISCIENKELIEFFNILDPNYKVPTCYSQTSDIDNIKEIMKGFEGKGEIEADDEDKQFVTDKNDYYYLIRCKPRTKANIGFNDIERIDSAALSFDCFPVIVTNKNYSFKAKSIVKKRNVILSFDNTIINDINLHIEKKLDDEELNIISNILYK